MVEIAEPILEAATRAYVRALLQKHAREVPELALFDLDGLVDQRWPDEAPLIRAALEAAGAD